MNGVINFYRDAPSDYRDTFLPGLICRAPIPFRLEKTAHRLQLLTIDDSGPQSAEFNVEITDLSAFNPRDDPSLRKFGLKSDEFLLSIGYKYRHCVMISEPFQYKGFNTPGPIGFTLIPLYSTHDEAGMYKSYLDYEVILRAQAYQYENIFFLPESKEFHLKESFARLDRSCFVNIELIQPKPVMLTERALELLREWNWSHLGFPLSGMDPALDKFIIDSSDVINKKYGISN